MFQNGSLDSKHCIARHCWRLDWFLSTYSFHISLGFERRDELLWIGWELCRYIHNTNQPIKYPMSSFVYVLFFVFCCCPSFLQFFYARSSQRVRVFFYNLFGLSWETYPSSAEAAWRESRRKFVWLIVPVFNIAGRALFVKLYDNVACHVAHFGDCGVLLLACTFVSCYLCSIFSDDFRISKAQLSLRTWRSHNALLGRFNTFLLWVLYHTWGVIVQVLDLS